MWHGSVVLIAFTERENLGAGYLSAVLDQAGYTVMTLDIRQEKDAILRSLKEFDPLLVGFSVIFEYHLHQFRELGEYLRNKGIHCHFTAGGLFASLRPDHLFSLLPCLDSIVRFEGEYTLLELVDHLHAGNEWHGIRGISCRMGKKVVHNPLRPLERDLDQFPYPLRKEARKYVLDKTYSTLIAGRGCIHHCSFCNIREFYRQPPGPIKRIRNPVRVAEEIAFLHERLGSSVFLFQDDDFPVKGPLYPEWVDAFCQELHARELAGKILWKINCRPDEIEREAFEEMRNHGLFRVYLGIEEGTDAGLVRMNKNLRVSDTLEGIAILKELRIGIDYGFMLFQPESTFRTIHDNLDFLENICGDGTMPVTFLKMKPFLGTKVEETLRREGRLLGEPGFLDYAYSDRSLQDFHLLALEFFHDWIHASEGFATLSKWAGIYLSLFLFYCGNITGMKDRERELRSQLSDANNFMIKTLRQLAGLFSSGAVASRDDCLRMRTRVEKEHGIYCENIRRIIGNIEMIYLTRYIYA